MAELIADWDCTFYLFSFATYVDVIALSLSSVRNWNHIVLDPQNNFDDLLSVGENVWKMKFGFGRSCLQIKMSNALSLTFFSALHQKSNKDYWY